MYKVVIEKEKPKCFICEKKKNEFIVVTDDKEEEEKGKKEQHSIVHIEDDNKNNNGNNNNMMMRSRNEQQESIPNFLMENAFPTGSLPIDPYSQIISLKQCEHTICKVCLNTTLKEQTDSNTLFLKCPHEDCDAEMDILHIIEQFSENNPFRTDLTN